MNDYMRVVGRFFTHQRTDNVPVPLVGRVFFTPVTSAYGEGTVYGAVERTGYVVDGVLCEDKAGESPGLSLLAPGEGVQPSAWSYRVVFSLTDEDGDRACLKPFYVEAKAGEEVDLATVSPVPDPITGEYVTRGERGPAGRDGVSPPAPNLSVGEVSEGEPAAIISGDYPDLKLNLTIPRGAAGPQGAPGVTGPRGERGEAGPRGADAEPLNLAVTASTLAAGSEATASLSGDYPNLTLALGLPVGAKGETGVGTPGPKGERGDVTVTQQGMVFGEGFPEGKVTATPGTVYTDTAATNGAMQWIKKTGTGATGWDVTVGDTGERDITTLCVTGFDGAPVELGQVLLRVTDRIVTVKGSYKTTENSRWQPFKINNFSLAERLVGSAWWIIGGGHLQINKGSARVEDGAGTHIWKAGINISFQASGLRTSDWPSVLPGTPA